MIEKMTKYSFVLLKEQTEGFLEKLQSLGVMDITRSVKPFDAESVAMLEKNTRRKKAIKILESLDYSKDEDYTAILDAEKATAIEGCKTENTLSASTRLEELRTELSDAIRKANDIAHWGEFDKAAIDGLEARGMKIRFYCVAEKAFKPEWTDNYAIEEIAREGKKIYFVTVSPADAEYNFPLEENSVPSMSPAEADAKIKGIEDEIIATKGKLLFLKDNFLEHIKKTLARKDAELDRYMAQNAGESAAEGMLDVFTGFAPISEDGRMKAALDAMDVYYIAEAAVEEDNPPIKLRNNWFARQFEVLTGMYGMPVYGEFDPTPILAPFYLLFFAFCMGDAGYGLVLILFGIAVNRKWLNIDMFKNIGTLISTLGVGTLIVGLVLGTAFGMNLYEASWMPQWLKSIMIVDSSYPDKPQWISGFSNQMVLAVGIGIFHICLAMIVKAIGYTKRFGFKKNIDTWAWTLLIVGGITVAGLALSSVISSEVTKWLVIVLGTISGLGIFIFNTPGRNPLLNIGSGLWATYNTATGLLGDALSYIRLYALGLAGGMLGGVFNDLGIMVAGNGWWAWIFALLILILGHVLNIAMACLGAFVHPLRLTFVEYFKNSGYEGKGLEYNPLSKKNK